LKQVLTLTGIFLVSFLFQTTVFPLLFLETGPDFPAVVIILLALMAGRPALMAALVFGAALDLLSGKYLGLNSLTLALVSLAVISQAGRVFKDNYFVPALFVLAGSLFKGLLWVILARFAGMILPEPGPTVMLILKETFFNVLLGLLVYPLLLELSRRGFLFGGQPVRREKF